MDKLTVTKLQMEMELFTIKMETLTLEPLKIDQEMERELSIGQMAVIIVELGSKMHNMVLEFQLML